MRYRIENVDVPEYGGIAQPEDRHASLEGRRIVHVIEVKPGPLGSVVTARVLTEEAEPVTVSTSRTG